MGNVLVVVKDLCDVRVVKKCGDVGSGGGLQNSVVIV